MSIFYTRKLFEGYYSWAVFKKDILTPVSIGLSQVKAHREVVRLTNKFYPDEIDNTGCIKGNIRGWRILKPLDFPKNKTEVLTANNTVNISKRIMNNILFKKIIELIKVDLEKLNVK